MKPIIHLLIALLCAQAFAAEKPNFIVINIDDMGYADIGPFGSRLNRTPHLDRMAKEGRKLTSFYAAPVCSPSRAALMTGCYAKRALPIPHVLFPESAIGLSPKEITIAEVLKGAGYATAIIGKWHLGDQPEFLPNAQGFDLHFGLPYSNDMGPAEDGVKSDLGKPLPPTKGKGQPPLPLLRNGQVVKRVLPDDQQSLVEIYTDEALKFIAEKKNTPFFLYLPHNAVHFPIYPGKRWAGKSPNGIYSDWVEEVDWSVGRVLDALRDNGLAERTLVIFTTDNGGTPRAVNAPLRGHKGSTLEGGMRVPTVAWWPGKIPAGTESDAITGMFDILPTCAALAGAKLPADRKLDGANIWAHLAGEPDAKPAHDTFFYYNGLRLNAVRHGDWKLQIATGNTADPATKKFQPQLFNLRTDIGEATNVAAANPEIVAMLQALIAANEADLGTDGLARGCRELGRVENPKPLIPYGTTADANKPASGGNVTSYSQGLHGYIGFGHEELPAEGGYTAGMGFYAAVWPLVDQPLAGFQIGLPSSWIQPDNSDNKDQPLAPQGTLARQWKERGPTWSTVFQTVEGGLGYWAGNHFRYGPPKFSMNATPQCYDYEVGSPGWSFFYSNEALPDNRLGIAQLSNRLLIPPDGLPFQGQPNGEFLGYTWMALLFTDPTTDDPPTGDQSWTCFLSAANFKGPIAYYIPDTWSKIGKLFNEPFLHGRGLDARPGKIGGGAMEINTVPRFDSMDAQGTAYTKLPKLQFPVDVEGRAFLVQDVTYYSKSALSDAFKSWRDGGPACDGRIGGKGAFKPKLNTHTTRYDQAGKKILGVERAFDTRIFDGNVWGLQWFTNDLVAKGLFPQYYKHVGGERVAVPAAAVPAETRLLPQEFKLAGKGAPYTSPNGGAWAKPGPRLGPFTARLVDGSVVTYSWYRFVDQPSFQQYQWSAEKRAKLQALVEKLHAHWTLDRDYMAPPTRGKLVALDPALLVTPPTGLEVGYVPIVTRQEAKD